MINKLEELLTKHIVAGNDLRSTCFELCFRQLLDLSNLLYTFTSLRNSKKIFICGNGGSAGDAQHLTAELVVRFQEERNPFPAFTLGTNSSVVSAIGNDYNYDIVFQRELEALSRPDDILIMFSTSGTSKNIVSALEYAEESGLTTVGFTGNITNNRNRLLYCDHVFGVPSNNTALIQECHIMLIHSLCLFIEKRMSQGE